MKNKSKSSLILVIATAIIMAALLSKVEAKVKPLVFYVEIPIEDDNKLWFTEGEGHGTYHPLSIKVTMDSITGGVGKRQLQVQIADDPWSYPPYSVDYLGEGESTNWVGTDGNPVIVWVKNLDLVLWCEYEATIKMYVN